MDILPAHPRTIPSFGKPLHHLLLRLAGNIPDNLISQSRDWLAEERFVDVAQALAFEAMSNRTPLAGDAIDLIRHILERAKEDTTVLENIPQLDHSSNTDELPPFIMAPASPDILAKHGEMIPQCLDLTNDGHSIAGPDLIDQAAIHAISPMAAQLSEETANIFVGMWRAWRLPEFPSPWPVAQRVYVVELTPQIPDDLPQVITGRLQSAVRKAGDSTPQIEVIIQGGDIPPYQRLAQAFSALLWSPEPQPSLRLARAFDYASSEEGPAFDSDHPLITDEAERERIRTYLNGGAVVLLTSVRISDVIDPAKGSVVPMDIRTDGTWIWVDATHYFLEHHYLAPEPEFLKHIRDHEFVVPKITSAALHRATALLQVIDLDILTSWALDDLHGMDNS